MTEWETKNGHVTYKESADKLPAISKYYDYDNGAPGKSAQLMVSLVSTVTPMSC